MDGAVADHNEALKLNPKFAPAYASRGYLLYDSRAWKDALIDFQTAIENDSSNQDYVRLRIYLIRARLGETEAATRELEQYLDSRKSGKPDEWFSSVARFLTGRISEEILLKTAERGNEQTIREQRCEAYFYAGTLRLLKGDRVIAGEYFQRAVDTNVKDFTEYQSAKAELEALRKSN